MKSNAGSDIFSSHEACLYATISLYRRSDNVVRFAHREPTVRIRYHIAIGAIAPLMAIGATKFPCSTQALRLKGTEGLFRVYCHVSSTESL